MLSTISLTALVATMASASVLPVAERGVPHDAGYDITFCTGSYGKGECDNFWVIDQGCQSIPKDSFLYHNASSAYTADIPSDPYPTDKYFHCDLCVDDGCFSTVHTYEPRQGEILLADYPTNDDNGETLHNVLQSYHCKSIPGNADPKYNDDN